MNKGCMHRYRYQFPCFDMRLKAGCRIDRLIG